MAKLRRDTVRRRAILRFLRTTTAHPTADQIYEEVRKEFPSISKGTVYRNLRLLQEMGLVVELDLEGAVSRFEAKCDDHYHFRCEKCGRVIDVDVPVDRELDRRVSSRTGLTVFYHRLEFRGLCNDCQKR
ncbi:MAG: transcriptional repressor [Dehalococcoidia bacterium]|nr:transcriptional repressor [Dehalococcoidia bacterium]